MNRDVRALVRHAEACGWTVVSKPGKHVKLKSPDGAVVTMSATPSDGRAIMNMRSDLRRAGLEGI